MVIKWIHESLVISCTWIDYFRLSQFVCYVFLHLWLRVDSHSVSSLLYISKLLSHPLICNRKTFFVFDYFLPFRLKKMIMPYPLIIILSGFYFYERVNKKISHPLICNRKTFFAFYYFLPFRLKKMIMSYPLIIILSGFYFYERGTNMINMVMS